MKQARMVFVMVLALAGALLLTGCEGAKLTATSFGNRTTIEAKDAEDGAYGEIGPFSVGKGKTATVESSLDKGELTVEFMEVVVFHNDEEPDDVMYVGVAASVTVSGTGDRQEIALEQGDYLLQYTTSGETNGTVIVNITG